jgi:hypothetical protein
MALRGGASQCLWRDYIVADRVVNELRERMQVEFEHDFSPVGFHSPVGNSQLRGDCLIGFSLCQKSNDFGFTGSRPDMGTLSSPAFFSRI